MKVYVRLAVSHERGVEEDGGVTRRVIDVVDVEGLGDDVAEAFQDAWQKVGRDPLEEAVDYTVRWDRVEPPAPATPDE
jgi:hypothetical protein